jgi:hypothetical protein
MKNNGSHREIIKGTPKATLYELLNHVIEKDDMSDSPSKHLWYLVSHLNLSVHDIENVQAGETSFLFVPAGTPITNEDCSNMGIEAYQKNIDGFDIYFHNNP